MTVKELIEKLQTHNGDMEVHIGQGIADEEHGYYPIIDTVYGLQETLIDDKTVLMICDDFWRLITAGKI